MLQLKLLLGIIVMCVGRSFDRGLLTIPNFFTIGESIINLIYFFGICYLHTNISFVGFRKLLKVKRFSANKFVFVTIKLKLLKKKSNFVLQEIVIIIIVNIYACFSVSKTFSL